MVSDAERLDELRLLLDGRLDWECPDAAECTLTDALPWLVEQAAELQAWQARGDPAWLAAYGAAFSAFVTKAVEGEAARALATGADAHSSGWLLRERGEAAAAYARAVADAAVRGLGG